MAPQIIKPGILLYKSFLSVETQKKLVEEIKLIREEAPFIRFSFKSSYFNTLNTSCGERGWCVIDDVYQYTSYHPITGKPWPAFTPTIQRIADNFRNGRTLKNEPCLIDFQSCLINLYKDERDKSGKIKPSKLGLHQDKTESIRVDIVNVSLGDDAVFVLGGTNYEDPKQNIILQSGDILVMRGPGRMCYHAIERVIPDTSNLIQRPGKGLGIRLNLTLRQVSFETNTIGYQNPVDDISKEPEPILNEKLLFLPKEYVEMMTMEDIPEENNEVKDVVIWEDFATPEPFEIQKVLPPTKRTVFSNTIHTDTSGDIKTYTVLPVFTSEPGLPKTYWDLNVPQVVFRNVLLTALHPTIPLGICDISKMPTSIFLKPFTIQEEGIEYQLDMASGSRNHARFTFSALPKGQFYFGNSEKEQWKRIIYGSILHTGCRQIRYEKINYIIVNDELKDENGNLRDDPTNNMHWHSGDSHMKGSKKLFDLVGLNMNRNDPEGEEIIDTNRPFQIRIGCYQKWVAKGTIAYNHLLDETEWDLVIPQSSLKGNKPECGNYTDQLFMGVVHEAEDRFAKPGWMLWQWFTFEQMQEDGIIKRLIERLETLKDVSTSTEKLANFMRRQIEEYRESLIERNDLIQSEKDYEDIFLDIIMTDKRGILLTHPYVVYKIEKQLQSMWIQSCTAAGVWFHSVMTMPDESLSHYHVVHKDGRITGRKVFCAAEHKEGEYIVFCNPMRHWGDVQVWENVHEGAFTNAVGVMAVPTKLALTLGRDFDGDFVQLINCKLYPNITKIIKTFPTPPTTVKFPKVALSGDLTDIAAGSITDKTGIVASLIAQMKGMGLENDVMFLPPDYGEPGYLLYLRMKTLTPEDFNNSRTTLQVAQQVFKTKWFKNIRLVDFLSQQLQIAVDSLKSAFPNNDGGLDIVSKFIKRQALERYRIVEFPLQPEPNPSDKRRINVTPWLKDFKDTDNVFINRPAAVLENAPDTISQLVRLVNSYWQQFAIRFEDIVPKQFRETLFSGIPFTSQQEKKAVEDAQWYRDEIRKVRENNKKTGNDNTIGYRSVNHQVRKMKEDLGTDAEFKKYTMESWAAAYWYVCNSVATGKATLVFTMFHHEILSELESLQYDIADFFAVYHVDKNEWAHRPYRDRDSVMKPGYTWTGEIVQVQVRQEDYLGANKLVVYMQWDGARKLTGWHKLGLVESNAYGRILPGETRTMKCFTSKREKNLAMGGTSEVVLVMASATKKQLNNTLMKYLRKDAKQELMDQWRIIAELKGTTVPVVKRSERRDPFKFPNDDDIDDNMPEVKL